MCIEFDLTRSFKSIALVFIGKQFLFSFKILMLHASLDSILLISSIKFKFFPNIITRYLTNDDSPMITPLVLRYDGVRAIF